MPELAQPTKSKAPLNTGREAPAHRGRGWQIFASSLCFLFGLALIANIHPIGDGLWFWYASLMRKGHLLYADLHLGLQPLFVLLTAWTQALFGDSWLASKALALAQLIAYCVSLFLISGFIPWKDWHKAILIIAAYGMMMGTSFFRYDDFHITGYFFETFSIYLLLLLGDQPGLRRTLLVAAPLGVIAGLSTTNRLNDGAALFLACAIVLALTVRRNRTLAVAIFSAATLFAMVGVIALTGDTLRNWALNSIIGASAMKGGTARVLYTPLLLPFTAVKQVLHRVMLLNLLYAAFVIALCLVMQRFARRADGRLSAWKICLGIALLAATFPPMFSRILAGQTLASFAALGALVSFALGALLLLRLVRGPFRPDAEDWQRRELLLLIPFVQLFGIAMTAGKSSLWAYSSVAELLLLLPITLPGFFRLKWQKTAYLALACVIIVSAYIPKAEYPYSWHQYLDQRLFADRLWYHHPVYGEMYIERDQLQFMQSICGAISKDGAPQELLSLPFPYPNYFCNVTPWHGHVQTWYDTTGKQTVDSLITDLQASPPKWIIYQRAPYTMLLHENGFTGGQPLPHRALDRLILNQIADGRWMVAGRQTFQGADWILVQTRP